jgi:hypothetical protein
MATPIGVTLNNPLNMRPDGKSRWQGMVGVRQTASGPFLEFLPVFGWRAPAVNLIAYQDRLDKRSIAAIVASWAPAADRNDPVAYAAAVSRMTGFGVDAILDLHRYEHLKPLIVAMATVEQGKSPYTWWSDAQIDEGLRRAGVVPAPKPVPKGPIVAGTATGTVATIDAVTNASVPVAPSTPSAIDQAQSLLQQLAPYFKWAGVALLLLSAGYFVWRWWQAREKRKQGIA